MVQLRELDGCGHSLTVLISVIRRALDKEVMLMAIKYQNHNVNVYLSCRSVPAVMCIYNGYPMGLHC